MKKYIDQIQIGQRIKNIRINLGKTMEDFGNILLTSKGTVNNWEKGRNLPNKDNLKSIADLGGLSVEEVLYGPVRSFISRVAIEEIDRLEQERIKNGDRMLTPSIKKVWLEQVITAELETEKNSTAPFDYAEIAESVKRYLSAMDDFAYLMPSEAAEAVKANNLSSKELLHRVAPLADPKTYEEIIQHYDRIDDLLPKLEQ